MMELVDIPDLKFGVERRTGSIPVRGTKRNWYKGIILGFHPRDMGSIPIFRTILV